MSMTQKIGRECLKRATNAGSTMQPMQTTAVLTVEMLAAVVASAPNTVWMPATMNEVPITVAPMKTNANRLMPQTLFFLRA